MSEASLEGRKGIRVFKAGKRNDPDPVKRGPYTRVTNDVIPSQPVPLKGNAILDAGLNSETLEVLSLVTEDDYYLSEIYGLFRRLYPGKTDDDQVMKFSEAILKLVGRDYLQILPEGRDDYVVAEAGLDEVLRNRSIQDAFVVRVLDAGRRAYFSLGPSSVDSD